MFDIAWSEFLIVGVVALVVVGPRDLPGLLRQVGRMIGTVRRMAGEFQGQFNEALREAELDELRRGVSDIKSAASKAMGDPFSIARDELKTAIDAKPAVAPSALSGGEPTAETAGGPDRVPSALAPPPPAEPDPVTFDRAVDAEPTPTPADRAPMTEPKRRPKRAAQGPAS